MKLNAPTQTVFLIAVILAILSMISVYAVNISLITGYEYLLLVVAFGLLTAATVFKKF